MRRPLSKALFLASIIALVAIAIYLWLVVAFWTLAFVFTILAVGTIVYGIARFKFLLGKGNRDRKEGINRIEPNRRKSISTQKDINLK